MPKRAPEPAGYILMPDKTTQPVFTVAAFDEWLLAAREEGLINIASDTLPSGTRISTIFLALDHSFGIGEPILFETRVLGGVAAESEERYRTYAEAMTGHALMAARVQQAEAQAAEEDRFRYRGIAGPVKPVARRLTGRRVLDLD